ncbi:hypothetical protein TNCV_4540781 [Trichonephila clavipes]|nr:hypothetical protein TNCV_4540781 [Trichonephila clavipes]
MKIETKRGKKRLKEFQTNNMVLYKRICRELPHSTGKFGRVIVGSMVTTNQRGIWGRKRRLVGENCNNSSRGENAEQDEGECADIQMLHECLNGEKYRLFLQHVIPELLQGV